MKITKISVLNFLGISSFKANRLGKLNRITGGNGTGKSSVLKAITEAIQSSGVNPEVIKLGEERSEILIELDNSITIERKISLTANTAKVVVDGQPVNKPQKYLNDLIGPFNFSPVDFFMLAGGAAADRKKARNLLLSSINFYIDYAALNESLGDIAVPIDLSKFDYTRHGLLVLEEISRTVYEQRHEVNIILTRLKKAIEQDKIDIPENFNRSQFDDFDLNEKVEQISQAQVAINNHNRNVNERDALRVRGNNTIDEIAQLEKKLDMLRSELASISDAGKELTQAIENFVSPNVESIQEEINNYKQSQKLINKLEEIDRKEDDADKTAVMHKTLDKLHKVLVSDVPKKMLSEVQLPVEGLEIKGEAIYVKGVAIQNMSTSEQITIAVSIAKSLAGDLKVICVDRYESLDRDAQKALEKVTKDDEFEYFMTVVTEGDLTMESTGTPKQKKATPMKPETTRKTSVGF